MKTAENTDNKLYGLGENVNDQREDENTISTEERKELDDTENNSGENEDERLINASMENVDEDSEPLNEGGFGDNYSGNDLDLPRYNDDYDGDDRLGEDDDNEEDDDE